MSRLTREAVTDFELTMRFHQERFQSMLSYMRGKLDYRQDEQFDQLYNPLIEQLREELSALTKFVAALASSLAEEE